MNTDASEGRENVRRVKRAKVIVVGKWLLGLTVGLVAAEAREMWQQPERFAATPGATLLLDLLTPAEERDRIIQAIKVLVARH